MYYYSNSNTLAHHGILGQRWGKRNGPPYPLGASEHSSSEKKAGWRKSLTRVHKKEYNNDKEKSSSSDTKEKHQLTDKQKTAIKVGAAAVVTALAAYGTYKLVKSGKLDELVSLGKSKVELALSQHKVGSADGIDSGLKRLAKPETLADTLENVNPNFGKKDYNNNCSLCGIASFLRQNGYDVKAGKTGGKPTNLGGVIEECFKDAKVIEGSAVKFGRSRNDAAEMLVKRFGDNASGVVGITWKRGSGHTFNWKITDGVVSFFDSQVNRDDSMVSSAYWNSINPNGNLTLARLDNAEPNFDGIKKWLE